ncbi:hypothetical protein BOTBODRAFT_241473 [Botryobasidium botryosum FD-172 SS1]|uniref:DUF6533 domain-containing protein n=1 Tax=Botryobasidium botryosum (strain FD-172 SS1) TaxID=930990 RepID=A0A067MQ74_BOTB1|nr:hypothetical protein BOTBODRAFT_241473 [Botryobasidium botryosum FD-172 SS1]
MESSFMDISPVAINYSFVASLVVLSYDHALTLNDEVRLVWSAPWNTAKLLFLWIRYCTPMCMIVLLVIESQKILSFQATCALDPMFFLTSLVATQCAADFLLLLRVHAIWGRTWKVLILMGTLWAAIYISFMVMFVEMIVHTLMSGPEPAFCYELLNSLDIFAWVTYIFSLLFDTTAFFMMVSRALMHRRARQIREPLLQTFYGYGIGYFACLTLLKAFVILGSAGHFFVVYKVAMHFVRCLSVTLTTRMYLSIRSIRTHQDWAAATNVKSRQSGARSSNESMELSVLSISRRHCIPPV